jgi:hypothetical protein
LTLPPSIAKTENDAAVAAKAHAQERAAAAENARLDAEGRASAAEKHAPRLEGDIVELHRRLQEAEHAGGLKEKVVTGLQDQLDQRTVRLREVEKQAAGGRKEHWLGTGE